MTTILQIRGTSGSGKTWAMKEVMRLLGGWAPVHAQGTRRRPLYYRSDAADRGPVLVLGAYETACGGCDGIGSARAVFDLTRELLNTVTPEPAAVLMEGLLLSEDSLWTPKMLGWGTVSVYFLTTPVDRCLTQVRARRAAAGNEKPLDPKNTIRRVSVVGRARGKLLAAGVDCRRCPAAAAPGAILERLRGGGGASG